jgi:LacI family transcriptional regulator
MGVLDVLRARNLRVPADVSVVGHNDMPLDSIDPPLTTVRVAVEQMGMQAAQMLLDLMPAPTQAPVTRMLLPQLVVRRSTAPVKSRSKG